jgi:hypothetical protein
VAEPIGYDIDLDISYFDKLFKWIKAQATSISPSDNSFAYKFPGELKVIVVPPDVTQIKMQSAGNPALFMAKPEKNIKNLEFMYNQWSEDLGGWQGQGGKKVPDPQIKAGSTILTRGHGGGTAALSPAQRCMDAAVVWHETGHAIAVASSKDNTEGYAYEFELCTLAYAIGNDSIAEFGFTPADVVEYIEKLRIGQFASYSGKQVDRVKAALTRLRDVLNSKNEQALGNRINSLLPQL